MASRKDMTDAAQRRIYFPHPYISLSLTSHSQLGAYHVEPPLKDKADLSKLRVPQLLYNRQVSDEWLSAAMEIMCRTHSAR